MPLYTAPSTDDLSAKIRRALRDAAGAVFEPEQIIDFINAGLAELSTVRPIETAVIISDAYGLAGASGGDYSVSDLDSVWQVELVGIDGTAHEGVETTIPPEDTSTNWRNGWDFVGGTIVLPHSILDSIVKDWDSSAPTYQVIVRGYRHRTRVDDPATDTPELLSLPEEQAVVFLAQKAGFEALLNDRALFQQWQTATGATDISPNQLSQMVYGAQTNWERFRKRLQIIRRQPVGIQ